MKTIRDLWAAFTTNPHVQAVKNLRDVNGDGKVDLKDLEAEAAKVKAELESRQANYYHVAIVVVVAFVCGLAIGHRYL